MTSIFFGIGIACYVFWVIRKKYKDIKNGRYCECGCDNCSQTCSSKNQ